jgi:uncharacterized protein (UPF0335 family)
MPENGSNGGDASVLAGYIGKIEDLENEKHRTNEAIKSAYSAAETDGIDKLALKQIIKDRRGDLERTAELRIATDRLRTQLAGLADTELGQWALNVGAALTTARKRSPNRRPFERKAVEL